MYSRSHIKMCVVQSLFFLSLFFMLIFCTTDLVVIFWKLKFLFGFSVMDVIRCLVLRMAKTSHQLTYMMESLQMQMKNSL